jgi:hypothetical protein
MLQENHISTFTFNPVILFFAAFLCLSSLNISAQVEQVDRIEIPESKSNDIRAIYNFGKDGLVISTKELVNKSKRDPDRVFRHYNTNLEETGSYSVEVPFRQKFTKSYESDSSVFILNHDQRLGDFTLIELRGSDLQETRTLGKLPAKTTIERMFCYSNFAVIYGNVAKRKQTMFVIDLDVGSWKEVELPVPSRKQNFQPLDFYVNEDGVHAFMLFEICAKKKCYEYQLYRFNELGDHKVKSIETGEHKIVSATMTSLGADEYIIAGTYTDRNYTLGKGMFISHYSNGNQNYFKTYPFSEFDRYLDYLPPRQRDRVERKTNKRLAQGREVNYSNNMVLHEVIELNNEYIIVGEAYYPTYRTETRSGPNGGVMPYEVFDGYQYSHASMVAFSQAGDKLYDNTFTMYLYDKPYNAKKFIELGVNGGRINMVYADNKFIRTKVFEEGETIEEEQSEIIDTGNENDYLRGSSSEIEYWYDDYFVSYGYQDIKNRVDRGVSKRRYVFFIQKLKF